MATGYAAAAQGFVFITANGDVVVGGAATDDVDELDVAEINRRMGLVITADTGATLWGGERLDLGLTLDALLCLENRDAATKREPGPA